jgi:hypothetical protein
MKIRSAPYMKLIDSIEDPTGCHCVDLIFLADDAFTFKTYRRDPEDSGRWTLTGDFSRTSYGSADAALRAASGVVPWLKPALSRASGWRDPL